MDSLNVERCVLLSAESTFVSKCHRESSCYLDNIELYKMKILFQVEKKQITMSPTYNLHCRNTGLEQSKYSKAEA